MRILDQLMRWIRPVRRRCPLRFREYNVSSPDRMRRARRRLYRKLRRHFVPNPDHPDSHPGAHPPPA